MLPPFPCASPLREVRHIYIYIYLHTWMRADCVSVIVVALSRGFGKSMFTAAAPGLSRSCAGGDAEGAAAVVAMLLLLYFVSRTGF